MKAINPRPGVVVAITDRLGDIAVYDPGAFIRRERSRRRKAEEEHDEQRDSGD